MQRFFIMCGIMGYIGDENATEIIISGLEELEYRGYKSASVTHAGQLTVLRRLPTLILTRAKADFSPLCITE